MPQLSRGVSHSPPITMHRAGLKAAEMAVAEVPWVSPPPGEAVAAQDGTHSGGCLGDRVDPLLAPSLAWLHHSFSAGRCRRRGQW